MPVEIYCSGTYGRRIRRVTNTAGLRHILGSLWSSVPPTGCANAPLAPAPSATITGLPAAPGADALIDLNFHSQPLAQAKVATVVFALGAAADVTFTVNLPQGTTGTQAATAIAAAAQWGASLGAVHAGAQVTVTNNHATDSLTKLTVSIA
jgi:hypothetical protein